MPGSFEDDPAIDTRRGEEFYELQSFPQKMVSVEGMNTAGAYSLQTELQERARRINADLHFVSELIIKLWKEK